MADFITLTGHNGRPIRFRSSAIVAYEQLDRKTAVYVYDETYHVTETPEQIDAMLGVTDSGNERETVRWYRYSAAGYATVHWTVNSGGFVLIPEGQTVAAGWWMYECTDCDERGKFDRLHRAKSGAGA